MSYFLHLPITSRVGEGRSGSENPLAVYSASLWDNWGWGRRLGSVAARLVHFGAALSMLAREDWKEVSLGDAGLLWSYGLFPRELAAARQSGIGDELDVLMSDISLKAIYSLLNPRTFPLQRNLLLDKYRFDRLMRANGLPVPPTFGKPEAMSGLPEWTAQVSSLLFKPGFSHHGDGLIKLDRGRDGLWSRHDAPGETFAIDDWVRQNVRDGDVVQELLKSADPLLERSPRALSTLRVLTFLNERDEPEVTHAILRMGGGQSLADNIHASGVAASIDLSTGIVRRAFSRTERGELYPVDRHPVTGAMVAGFEVPHFQAALDLARAGHELLRGEEFLVIGWDIGLTDEGPVLIEGNSNPGSPTSQNVSGRGLAATRIGELMSFHLKQIPRSKWRSLPILSRSSRKTAARLLEQERYGASA